MRSKNIFHNSEDDVAYTQLETDLSDHFDAQTRACRNLLSAVLNSAIHDLKRGLSVPTEETHHLRQLSIMWFWGEIDSRISFNALCTALDQCPDVARERLIEKGILPKKMGEVLPPLPSN